MWSPAVLSLSLVLALSSFLCSSLVGAQEEAAVIGVPNIYRWVAENAHICTIVTDNGQAQLDYLSERDGANCGLCPELRLGELAMVACAFQAVRGQLHIGCHPVPELCFLEYESRYRPVMVSQRISSNRIEESVESPSIPIAMLTTTTRSNTIPSGRPIGARVHTVEASLNLGVTASPGENRISPPMGNPGNRFRIRTIDDRKEMMNKKTIAVVGGNQSECIDAHTLCCFWALAGECDKNPFWMRTNCRKTCGTCDCKLRSANRCLSTGIHCESSSSPTPSTVTTKPTTKNPTSTTPEFRSSLKTLPTHPVNPYDPPGSVEYARTSPIATRRPSPPPQMPRSTAQPPAPLTTMPVATTRQPSFAFVSRTTIYAETEATTIATSGEQELQGKDRDEQVQPTDCVDLTENCKFWADIGECDRNPFWMRPSCQKSCRSCGEDVGTVFAPLPRDGCHNDHPNCQFWAFNNECDANPKWMLRNCRLSCQIC